MRVSYEELLTVLTKTTSPKILRDSLRYIFSFKENIDTFSNFIFPDAMTSQSPQFHEEIYEFLEASGDGALAAPRGHAKSTIAGLFYITWLIVNKKEKYIVYVSSNHTKTVQFLDPIRDAFKDNKRLRELYDLRITMAKDDDGRDREDCFDVLGCRVEAVSFEKNLRGFKYKHTRPTLIICDDIESDDRVLNPDLRLKDRYKIDKIIIPSLDPERGRMKMIGTILHWDSLLVNKIRLYNGRIYKACDEGFNNILWPQYWSEERLRNKRASIGSVSFASEYLNNPVESESSLIKKEWVDECKNNNLSYEEPTTTYNRYLGVDFAFGDRATNDNTVFAGVIEQEGKYILNRLDWYKGLSITEQFDKITILHQQHPYKEVVLEENSIKGMSKELKNYRFPYYLIWTGANDPAQKYKDSAEFEGKRHTVGKKNMILRLATLFENKKIVLPYKTLIDQEKTNRLTEELLTFALNDGRLVEVGIHADAPIALSMIFERVVEKPRYGWAW